MAKPNARSVALSVLETVERKHLLATAVLRQEKSARDLDPRVMAAATDLVLGTLRQRGFIDHHLRARTPKGLPEHDHRLICLLRLAAYELMFVERTPDYAGVSSYVEIAKRTHGQRVAGFVNAVLRGISAVDRKALALGRGALPPAAHFSFPDWAVEEARAAFGPEYSLQLETLNRPASIALRTHVGRVSADALARQLSELGLHPQRVTALPDALVLPPDEPPYESVEFLRGQFWPQDIASQLVASIAAALVSPSASGAESLRSGPAACGASMLLDACAGSGTKSLCLAGSVPSVQIVASDLSASKIAAMRRRLRSLQVPGVETVIADLTSPPFAAAAFDLVLLDAPCSGLGTVRRHPELKWRRGAGDLQANAARQTELLHHAARLVRPGGALVYAVCSFARTEGAAVVDDFLARHPWYRRGAIPLPGSLPAASVLTAAGDLLLPPSLLDSDCHFVALLRRAG